MKLTKSWLEDYIEIPFNIEELCHHLTMAGLEVDDVLQKNDDYIIDIDLTPNRSDCLSVLGVARELNSINKKYKYKNNKQDISISPSIKNTEKKIKIDEKIHCPKYGYMNLENIPKEVKTPEYIEKKINDIGIKSVHPIVDILNYIMIDIGQPMHAYDAEKITNEISVRFAKNNETIKALDGNEYKLKKENIVISDTKNVISLAGIIGAEDCSVKNTTKNILIECAFFMPDTLANKARKLKLHTESSHRYERGVDFNLPEKAMIQLQEILQENNICDFSIYNFIEHSDLLPVHKEVEINNDKIRKSIGIDLSDDEIKDLLLLIGCTYQKNIVKNPSFRYDLNIHADYVEEIARIYGYDNIPIVPEKISITTKKTYLPFKIINQIKQYLYKNSYSECINYSFVNDEVMENFDWKNEEFNNHNKIGNYMSLEQNKLRSNLASSLINNIKYNINMNSENSYRLFEISSVFGENIEQILTCVVTGNKEDENWAAKKQKFDQYDMTTIAEDIAKLFGLNKNDLMYKINELNENKNIYIVLSLSINELIKKIKSNNTEQFQNFSKLPYIRRDLSFIIDISTSYQSILNLIEKTNVLSLKKILLFDLYEGKNIPSGKKSLGMGFIFQDANKTLTHEEADQYIDIILKDLEEEFQIELRK